MPTNNKGLKELWGYPLIDEKARNAISDTRSSLENDFQKKTDDTLGTVDKTVPGAINEIKNSVDNIGDNFTSEQSDTKYDMKYNGKSIGSIGIELKDNQIAGGDGSFNIDLTPYQTKTDTSLTTTDKTISGAIKELNTQYKDIVYKKFNVRDYGAKGNGIDDDSISIRNCINALPDENFELIIPPGVYIQGDGTNPSYSIKNAVYTGEIDIGNPIHFTIENKKNFKIYGYGATIRSHKNNSCIANNRGFSFVDCKNGLIEGLSYDGMKNFRKPNGGDPSGYNNQSGFKIENSDNLEFRNCKAFNCVMDGFTIRGNGNKDNPKGNNIRLINCIADNGYRQGLSVINSHYGVLENCIFSNTAKDYGTSPKAGVDLEQGYVNYSDRGQKEWKITNCVFENNEGGGLLLHWGTYNSIVDKCKFENNNLTVAKDSENLTINNTIINCTFQNSDIDLNGGGCYFKQNIIENGNLTVFNDLYYSGISRRNEIKENIFKWTFDPTTEILDSNNIISKKRRVNLNGKDIIFDNNILINPTGTFIPYCISDVESISNNTITSNIKCSDVSIIFGTISPNALKCSDNKTLSDKYNGYFNINNISIKSNLITVLYNDFKNSENKRIDIQFKGLTADDMNGYLYNIYLNYNGNKDLISRSTENNQTIKRISGNKNGLYKISKIYDKDSVATITMYPMTDNTSLYLTVELEKTKGVIEPKTDIITNVYVADSAETINYKETILNGLVVSNLPAEEYLYKGLSVFYNNKMVYWSGSNATKWVDAMGNSII